MNRPRTTARGYGAAHQRERERWRPIVDAGQALCTETTCLMPTRWIQPGTPWDLAHAAAQNGYRGPAHAHCNRHEAAARGNRARTTQWRTTRPW